MDYIVDHGEWWDEEELPLVFLSAVWNSWEVQQTLKDFINTRRALMKAQKGEERVSLGRASDALWGYGKGEEARQQNIQSFRRIANRLAEAGLNYTF